MIGNTYKKFAQENGLTVSNGVAYGSLRGYAASLFEGGGWKAVVFSVRFSDPARRVELMDLVGNIGDRQLYKTYRVNRLGITDRMIQIQFHDNPGTMKKIAAFLDWFIPLLDAHGASKANFCAECGLEIQDGDWIMVNGMCHHVHSACGEKIRREIDSDNQRVKEERTGSYLSGTLGAFLGAAYYKLPVVIDGYISAVAALAAYWLAPQVTDFMFGSHVSKEKGYMVAMDALDVKPYFNLGMRLGEGSGCPISFKIMETACATMNGMATFAEGAIDADYLQEAKKGNFF